MPIEIIHQQIQAYNTRNIELMMKLFSDEIQIFDLEDDRIIINGIQECKNMYVELFNSSPKLNAEVVNTIAFNNRVIVHEIISGRNGNNEKVEQVIIFEVNNDKIDRINLIRNKP